MTNEEIDMIAANVSYRALHAKSDETSIMIYSGAIVIFLAEIAKRLGEPK